MIQQDEDDGDRSKTLEVRPEATAHGAIERERAFASSASIASASHGPDDEAKCRPSGLTTAPLSSGTQTPSGQMASTIEIVATPGTASATRRNASLYGAWTVSSSTRRWQAGVSTTSGVPHFGGRMGGNSTITMRAPADVNSSATSTRPANGAVLLVQPDGLAALPGRLAAGHVRGLALRPHGGPVVGRAGPGAAARARAGYSSDSGASNSALSNSVRTGAEPRAVELATVELGTVELGAVGLVELGAVEALVVGHPAARGG